jgi:hypothetical protein
MFYNPFLLRHSPEIERVFTIVFNRCIRFFNPSLSFRRNFMPPLRLTLISPLADIRTFSIFGRFEPFPLILK